MMIMDFLQQIRFQQRRTFLGQSARGIGALALASLLNPSLLRAANPPTPSHDEGRWVRRSGGSGASGKSAAAGGKPQKWPGVVRPLHFPAKAKRVIWLCMAGGPSHLETLDFKPKLARDARQADARELHQGPADRAAPGRQAQLLRPPVRLQEVRQGRHRDLRAAAPHRLDRRRHLHHPLDAHRGDQPRPRPHVHEHRHHHLGPAQHGLVDHLRPGQRRRRLARLRRPHQPGPRRAEPAHRLPPVAQRLFAQPVPGRPVPRPGRPGPVPLPPQGRHRRPAARGGGRGGQAERDRERRRGRPRDRHAHQPVRDGVRDAEQRAGADGPVEGTEGNS